ncbi:hypothetical protein HNR19_003109 [Nocardioides thalensis]|uniref:Uncharacterized protein n=1 Tax=Nocardioides thalensis TaxID=1914755 RepID=A0A853C5H6_9ACTN|nr:hypothetical protein [Nocardioides thalensis]NYJ02411.1 hypothetical protein [Nocardioides thalensis]
MYRSNSMSWWLEHGLDGLVAGLIGGFMTGIAVISAIAWEASIRRQDRERAAHEELRRATVDLMSAANSNGEVERYARLLFIQLTSTINLAMPIDTAYAEELKRVRVSLNGDWVTLGFRVPGVDCRSSEVEQVATDWLSGRVGQPKLNPAYFSDPQYHQFPQAGD